MSPDPTATDLDRIQAALGEDYRLEREVGRGGMATVYLAHDRKHDRQVAVKVFHPNLAATLGASRFLQEIRVAAQFQHPHILTLIDSGEAEGFLYYVMPYVAGDSLRARLSKDGALPVIEAVRVLRDVVDALAHAHAHGVVHRDIKPDNVLFSERHAMVTDFGVAKAVSEGTRQPNLTTAGMALGTPAYMSPEQAAADPNIDHRADIYAVGILGYELLTGQTPFERDTAAAVLTAHLTETPPPVRTQRPEVPAQLEALIMQCLEKDPAQRWQTAEELRNRLDVLVTPSGGITPTDTRPLTALASRKRRMPVALAGAFVAALAAVFWLRPSSNTAVDRAVLAVAPFDVLGPNLEVWGEGVADLLAAMLDGAGSVRTVPPSVVHRHWNGRADPAAATALGEQVGSGLAVYGRIVAEGSDSVRLTATLFDVAQGTRIRDFEIRGKASRVPDLADTLAVRLMAELTSASDAGATRLGSLGSSSPTAIKAFLQGEQHYRRNELDSAQAFYEEAVAADSTFALALNRLGTVLGWFARQTESDAMALRAAAFNRGLAPRESLLIVADSLAAAVATDLPPDSTTLRLFQRLFATLELLDRRYPNDAQVQYLLGEAHAHSGWATGSTERQAMEAFARLVQLDSTFAPAYFHLIEFRFRFDQVAAARRDLAAYLALDPGAPHGQAGVLLDQLLDIPRADSLRAYALIDTVQADVMQAMWGFVHGLTDSVETATRITRRLARTDPNRTRILVWQLSARGQLQEAYEILRDRAVGGYFAQYLFAELALLGGVPDATAAERFERWLTARDWGALVHAVPWWADTGDTLSITRMIRAARAVMGEEATEPMTRAWLTYRVPEAEAYLALAHRDQDAALRAFERLPEPRCSYCFWERLTKARLLAAAGRDAEAVRILDGMYVPWGAIRPADGLWTLERARAHERLGNTERAIYDYGRLIDMWRYADSTLSPLINEAREARRRLGGL